MSEVLSGKRPLTLAMIRSLHRGLGIPAASLLGDRAQVESQLELDWKKVPFAEMKKRGWTDRLPRSASDSKHILDSWLDPVRVVELAPRFEASFSTDFLRDVARISVFKNGPSLVKEFLDQHGIVLVVEKALSPWLDGAAMMCRNVPVVALTLRHDRLDNFWFVLMHELVHLLKHLGGEATSFYDDLDSDDQSDPREMEADALGREILIPSDEWRTSPASRLRSADAANHLAHHLRIHPAIVAGRMRRTYKDYRVLSGLVGQGEVRKQFPEFKE